MGIETSQRQLNKTPGDTGYFEMETELFAACEVGDLAKVKELLPKETKETIDQVDFYGYTALHAAAENNRVDIIPLLLAAGADINRATYDATFTSLHHALAKRHWESAKLLIERGADVNLLNEGGCYGSSLHYAVFQDSEEFVKLILSKGGDVNLISGQGYTPLHTALFGDLPNIVKILVEAGADVNIQDEDELTALHVAARDGSGECALHLVKAGADLYITNNEGKTAEEMADFVNEQPMKAFLNSCASGLIPGEAPGKQVRVQVEKREIVIPEGWAPG